MTVTIDLPPELESALRQQAAGSGQDVAAFVLQAVQEKIARAQTSDLVPGTAAPEPAAAGVSTEAPSGSNPVGAPPDTPLPVAPVVGPPASSALPPPSEPTGTEPPAPWASDEPPAVAELNWADPPPIRQTGEERPEGGPGQTAPPSRHRPSWFGIVLGILILVLGHGAIVLWLWPWLLRHVGR